MPFRGLRGQTEVAPLQRHGGASLGMDGKAIRRPGAGRFGGAAINGFDLFGAVYNRVIPGRARARPEGASGVRPVSPRAGRAVIHTRKPDTHEQSWHG